MQRRINPPDRRPVAGATIPLIVTRTVEVQADQLGKPAANQRHGKLNYQGKPKKASKAPPAGRQHVERKAYGRGQYIGNGEHLTAFVWLEEEAAPKDKAANEDK
jgi:hypothetical protein